jgi:hypothetical protein
VTDRIATCHQSLVDAIAECETRCRFALENNYPELALRLSPALASPEKCFQLLRGLPYERSSVDEMRELRASAVRSGMSDAAHMVERFVVLQAYLVALRRLPSLPVDESVHRQFLATCRDLVSTPQRPDKRLAQECDAFAELAQIVTLRRFHAGQLSFDVMKIPRAWLLKVHPLDLPGLLREIISGFGGLGPVAMPHLCYWRANPLFVLRKEQERALWRIAKSMEGDARIQGFVSSTWLYSRAVGEVSPHLGWLRKFFVDHGAYVIDAGPSLEEAGFLVGSASRRELYSQGSFQPRETLVLWRRSDIIAWASARAEFEDIRFTNGSLAIAPPMAPQSRSCRPRSREISFPASCSHEARSIKDKQAGRLSGAATRIHSATFTLQWCRALRSGQCTLIDCKRLLFYRPRLYITLIFLLPALCAAPITAATSTATAGVLAFLLVFPIMWLFQYFFLQ